MERAVRFKLEKPCGQTLDWREIMKVGNKLLLAVIMLCSASFLLASLFVILFFRIYPNKFLFLFPAVLILGVVVGLLSYLPIKTFIEKE